MCEIINICCFKPLAGFIGAYVWESYSLLLIKIQTLLTCVVVQSLSHVLLFCSPIDCSPTGFLSPWNFPDKSTVVGCHFFLQGIFPNQGSNLRLLHWQGDSLPISHEGSPSGHVLTNKLIKQSTN